MSDAVIAIAGSSGLIGSALVYALRATDRRVLRIVRRAPSNADEVFWNPDTGEFDPSALAGVDAVVNLCGVNVGDKRWSGAFKQSLRDSRIEPTEVLAVGGRRGRRAGAGQRQRGRLLRRHRQPHRRRDRTGGRRVPGPVVPGLGGGHRAGPAGRRQGGAGCAPGWCWRRPAGCSAGSSRCSRWDWVPASATAASTCRGSASRTRFARCCSRSPTTRCPARSI